MTITPIRRSLLIAAALAALATPAPAQRGAAKTNAACNYITELEATQALGVKSHYRINDGESSNCVLVPLGEDVIGPAVDFEVFGNTRAYDDQARLAGTIKISGLGDKALWRLETPHAGTLVVVKGSKCVSFSINSDAEGADLKTPSLAFAKKVVARL